MAYLKTCLFSLAVFQFSCGQIEEQEKQSSVLIYYNKQDTTTDQFIQSIKELPEYANWEYNYSNRDTTTPIGYSHFVERKVISGEDTFYHIELFQRKFNKPIDSFIYPEELVCYFRFSKQDNQSLILDTTSKQFLDLKSWQGRQLFQNCLSHK